MTPTRARFVQTHPGSPAGKGSGWASRNNMAGRNDAPVFGRRIMHCQVHGWKMQRDQRHAACDAQSGGRPPYTVNYSFITSTSIAMKRRNVHGGRPHSPRLSARRVAMQQASIRTLLNVNGIIDNVDRTERLRLAVRSRICPYDSQELPSPAGCGRIRPPCAGRRPSKSPAWRRLTRSVCREREPHSRTTLPASWPRRRPPYNFGTV